MIAGRRVITPAVLLRTDGTRMWKLRGRDNKIRQWADLGEFRSIEDAAHFILQLEEDESGALFLRVYADPAGDKSDAEILSRLEYQSEKGFYLLLRSVQ
jgi:hypothetical protein